MSKVLLVHTEEGNRPCAGFLYVRGAENDPPECRNTPNACPAIPNPQPSNGQ